MYIYIEQEICRDIDLSILAKEEVKGRALYISMHMYVRLRDGLVRLLPAFIT